MARPGVLKQQIRLQDIRSILSNRSCPDKICDNHPAALAQALVSHAKYVHELEMPVANGGGFLHP